MQRYFIVISLALMLGGCATQHFGLSEQEWESLTPEEREEIKAKIKDRKEKKHTRDLTNKTLNDTFGTRANEY